MHHDAVRCTMAACHHRTTMQRIGLISDTHGLLRPDALAFLAGCDAIVHAGDICAADVLDRLVAIAPVWAVRGNNDVGAWADAFPVARTLALHGARLHVVHDVADLARHPPPSDVTIVVHGHSHKPAIVQRDGLTFVNPGSAGPRRFTLPISIGELVIEGSDVRPRLVTLTN
jgi:putative phosphoesterase